MPRRTEAWWVCNGCGKPIARPGRGFQAAVRAHRKEGHVVTGSIRQIEQRRRGLR